MHQYYVVQINSMSHLEYEILSRLAKTPRYMTKYMRYISLCDIADSKMQN